MHNAQYAAMSDPNNIMQLFMQQQQEDADAQAHIANLICSVRRDHLGKNQRFISFLIARSIQAENGGFF